ncbi:nucleotidyltransferase family protein [Chryseobacterium wangxinyae]|uniref:nucleotidyltransferase family protein n=1 Tax=Chryseobacterium sp. CY353 TaxID=2997334 RepID=UPI002272257B|nr:nucleotidyltransferase family protein [Chryseobacterium sp. CY353]MCY0970149.1 nucleotidyltransferase family protein [Chryseobacterium sp. CY353]
MDTGILILAAGNSSRLGEPKQLLKFNGTSLLRNVAEDALKTTQNIVVVTGFNHTLLVKEVENLNVIAVENLNWKDGMGSSIRVGINKLLSAFPDIENCIIAVCDQPYITSSVFNELIQKHKETLNGIVASKYSGILGTPVLFEQKYFKHLLNLTGNEGARRMIRKFKEDIAEVSFEKGAIDIDTPQDYKNLIS